ncbi:hypothetical protein CSHISOI_05850 [Colletotrichum shisoi]|uniref:Uncharacterized protein n=1 Tax=Colletotrichum shisoi TaxID=2078593 RepID=A0A5Q4BRJ6_9PEZI|nr:hypothetical protein CSHISOI_05850 [Colletotrichum shisoi]
MAPFTRALNWSKEEVIVFIVDVRKEFANKQIHAYFSSMVGLRQEAQYAIIACRRLRSEPRILFVHFMVIAEDARG